MISTFRFNGDFYELPTTQEPYFVYVIPSALMYVFEARSVPNEWVSTKTLCNDHNILIHTYHLTGKMMNKDHVFFKQDGRNFFLAIRKKMYLTVIDSQNYSNKNIRFTMYFDSDYVNDIHINTYEVKTTTDQYNLYLTYMLWSGALVGTPNCFNCGYELKVVDQNSFALNSYVDMIYDPNIVNSFDLNLSITANQNIYFSD